MTHRAPLSALVRHGRRGRSQLGTIVLVTCMTFVAIVSPSSAGAQEGDDASRTAVVETNGATYEPVDEAPQPIAIELDCYGQSSQYVIETYSRAGGNGFPAGISRMRCGSSGWGLRHIEQRHAGDWQAKANYVGASWEDFADFAIEQTLAAPSSISYRTGNDTWAYRAPIQIRDYYGNVIHQFTARVVVADDSKNIITAFPQ